MPDPKHIRFDTLYFTLGLLHIVDVSLSANHFRYRIFGSGTSYPRDLHGLSTAALRPRDYRALVEADYRQAAMAHAPALHRITLTRGPVRATYRRLLLPYGADDRHTTTLLVAIEMGEGLGPMFSDPIFQQPDGCASASENCTGLDVQS